MWKYIISTPIVKGNLVQLYYFDRKAKGFNAECGECAEDAEDAERGESGGHPEGQLAADPLPILLTGAKYLRLQPLSGCKSA